MKKKINIILALLFIICFVGVTFAYYSYSKTFNNNFDVGDFNVVIEEVFDENGCLGNTYKDDGTDCRINSITKEVYVVNKETTDAIVRISYNEYFSPFNDNEYTDVESITDFTIIKEWTSDFESDWILYNDWYYYKKILPAGEKFQLLSSVYSDDCCGIYTYNLDFNIEAIQADVAAVKELWNEDVTINTDGSVVWGFDTNDEDE